MAILPTLFVIVTHMSCSLHLKRRISLDGNIICLPFKREETGEILPLNFWKSVQTFPLALIDWRKKKYPRIQNV